MGVGSCATLDETKWFGHSAIYLGDNVWMVALRAQHFTRHGGSYETEISIEGRYEKIRSWSKCPPTPWDDVMDGNGVVIAVPAQVKLLEKYTRRSGLFCEEIKGIRIIRLSCDGTFECIPLYYPFPP